MNITCILPSENDAWFCLSIWYVRKGYAQRTFGFYEMIRKCVIKMAQLEGGICRQTEKEIIRDRQAKRDRHRKTEFVRFKSTLKSSSFFRELIL